MISYKKNYVAYRLDKIRGQYSPAKEKQLEQIRELFKQRFGVEPETLFVGPIKIGEQVLVHEDEVWIEMPEKKRGDHFVTAYPENET